MFKKLKANFDLWREKRRHMKEAKEIQKMVQSSRAFKRGQNVSVEMEYQQRKIRDAIKSKISVYNDPDIRNDDASVNEFLNGGDDK